jgi:hypothetical protein
VVGVDVLYLDTIIARASPGRRGWPARVKPPPQGQLGQGASVRLSASRPLQWLAKRKEASATAGNWLACATCGIGGGETGGAERCKVEK